MNPTTATKPIPQFPVPPPRRLSVSKKIGVFLNALWTLGVIISEAVILAFSQYFPCDVPLLAFLRASLISSCLYLVLTSIALLMPDTSHPLRKAAIVCLAGQNVFALAITVFGTIWVANASTCRYTSPSLWILSAVLVALGYVQGIVSVIIISISCYFLNLKARRRLATA